MSRNSAVTGWRSEGSEVGIGRAHRAEQHLVAHRAAIDEQILRQRIGLGKGRQAGQALEPRRAAHAGNVERVRLGLVAQHVGDAGALPAASLARAGQLSGARSSVTRVKPTSGRASARRFTTSTAAAVSARSDFRNFSRAGVAKNRSRTSTRVPGPSAAGFTADFAPPSTRIS